MTLHARPKPVIVGKLGAAKAEGLRGVVACGGCASTKGTLEGRTFRCETPGCKFRRKPAPASPWTKVAVFLLMSALSALAVWGLS